MADGSYPRGYLMTNIAKAIVRLREERRDAQNQVQKLGEAISVLEKLTRGPGATPRQALSLRGRPPENFSGPESTLGQDQTNKESSLNVGWAAGYASSARETAARP